MVDLAFLIIFIVLGDIIRHEFDATNTLLTVKQFIEKQSSPEVFNSSILRSTHPHRVFAERDFNFSLFQLQLVPSGTLILEPIASNEPAQNSSWLEGIWNYVSSFNPFN